MVQSKEEKSNRSKKYYQLHKERIKEHVKKYAMNNKEKISFRNKNNYNCREGVISESVIEYRKDWYRKRKEIILDHYSNGTMKCACCGEDDFNALTIDHINNDGAQHRKELKGSTSSIHTWLIKNNFPEGFQTLCFNCNWGKHINSGICPHKEK